MTAEPLNACLKQIRGLNNCLNVLLKTVQELNKTNTLRGGALFGTLIFLSAEVEKELASLEHLLDDKNSSE